MAAVVHPSMLNPGRSEHGRPLPVPELLTVDIAAPRGRKHERRVEPRRHRPQGVDDTLAERHAAALPRRLPAVLQHALREHPLDAEDALLEIEVATLQCEQLLRAKPGPDQDNREFPPPATNTSFPVSPGASEVGPP